MENYHTTMENYYMKGKVTLARSEVLPEEAKDYLCGSYPVHEDVAISRDSVRLDLSPGAEAYTAEFLVCVKNATCPDSVASKLQEVGITPLKKR